MFRNPENSVWFRLRDRSYDPVCGSNCRDASASALTDGRSPETPSRPDAADQIVIVDFENEAVRLGRCVTLAESWQADYRTAASMTSS